MNKLEPKKVDENRVMVGALDKARQEKGTELRDSSGLKRTQGSVRFDTKKVPEDGRVRYEKGRRVRLSSIIKGSHYPKKSKTMQGRTGRRSSYLKRTVHPSYFVTKRVQGIAAVRA